MREREPSRTSSLAGVDARSSRGSAVVLIELSSSEAPTSQERSTLQQSFCSDGSMFAAREYLSDRGCISAVEVSHDVLEGGLKWHRSARFILASVMFISDFLLRVACTIVYWRHCLLPAIYCQSAFQLLAMIVSVQVMWRDADVRRWIHTGSCAMRMASGFTLLVVLGCCQVIHVKRSWARQLRTAEVLRNLEGQGFLWAGPAIGAERTLPVALLTGVPFALLSAYTYLTLDSGLGRFSDSVPSHRPCGWGAPEGREAAVLAAATVLAVSIVGLGVVDVDLAGSAYVASRYHFDPSRRGSRAGRCQCLYPAVHAGFRVVEVLWRVTMLTEAAAWAQMLFGSRGLLAALALLCLDLGVGVAILRSHAPRSERLAVHALAGIGLLLADVTRFVDLPGFCLPARRISRALGWWRLLQLGALAGGSALSLRLSGRAEEVFSSQRWLRGMVLLSAAAAAYATLWLALALRSAGDDLHTAAMGRRGRRLRKLLEAGCGGEAVDVNSRTRDGLRETPLMLAAAAGDVEALHLLVGAGGHLGATDAQGEGCLHRAVRGVHLDSLDFMLQQPGGGRALHEARPRLQELAQELAPHLAAPERERLLALLSPVRSHRRSSREVDGEQPLRCVQPQLAGHQHLSRLFPDGLPDGVPARHELRSVSALVFAHAAGALAQLVLPTASGSGWLESLRRVRTLGRGALGEVIEVELKSPQECPGTPSSRDPLPSHGTFCESKPGRFAMKLQAKTQAQACWQACAEVVALRRAVHPFIVRLEQAFQTPEFYVLLLELCPCGDLNSRLCSERGEDGRCLGLPLKAVARYGGQVLLALVHLHEALGIIYRDVKPQNILISGGDEAKLADFGTARFVGVEERVHLPLVGTKGFLAPELVLGGFDSEDEELADAAEDCSAFIDPFKTDSYSFGVTLEVLLLGEECADVVEEDDGSPCVLPRTHSEAEVLSTLASARDAGRIPAEAVALLSELLPQRPSVRRCLADPVVRGHGFFLRLLECRDLAELLPGAPTPCSP